MTTTNLHVLGIDPGGTTGWCLITVLRSAVFADAEPSIIEWDYGELTGPEPRQATEIAQMCREIQGLDYKTGPAVMSERWTADPSFKSADQEQYSPIRINAQLELLHYQGKMGDSTLHFQSRTIKSATGVSDDRLMRLGIYVEGSKHIRDATKHALTALRRARESRKFALKLWPYPPTGMP
jgi:hypothetical protein